MRKKVSMTKIAKLKRTITRQCSIKRKYTTTFKDIKKYLKAVSTRAYDRGVKKCR